MTSYSGSLGAAGSGGKSQGTSQGTVQEFSIKVPKANKKKYQVMRFNATLGVDFTEWKTQGTQIKMERENNLKEFRGTEEEIPKFGAGSEFGKEAKEEARRKKYGIISKKYRPDDQPWILKTGGKNGKKFKGIREGGVSDNTAYYVFTQAGKGVIEAYPLQEWYKFQPIQRYKALSAEEAEEEFGRRNKIINYFSVMMKKRLRNEDDGDLDELEEGIKGKKGGGKKKKDKAELKISEMDDWVDSEEEASNSDEDDKKDDDDDEGEKAAKKKAKGKAKSKLAAKKKKKKKDSDDEAFEESDDGDEEGRELDYISDSSDSASDHEMKANKELKGVAEEDALRKLLNSESEEEDENEEKKKAENESNSEDEEKKKDSEKGKDKAKEDGSKKKKKKDGKGKKSKPDKKSTNGKKKEGEEDSSSELSPNTTDTDSDAPPTEKNKSSKAKDQANSAGSSRSTTPTPVAGEKRKLTAAESAVAAAKKAKLDSGSSSSMYIPSSSETGVTEDAVRRYLMRKPMTTIELVHKFKSKKTGLSSEQLVNLMTQILKNINPTKQTIKNKMYLSIKPT